MKFIRKNGHIIPIREKGDDKLAKRNSKGGYAKTAAVAATGMAMVGGGSNLASALGFRKAASAFHAGGLALSVAGIMAIPIVKGIKVQNEETAKTKDYHAGVNAGTIEMLKHWGVAQAGQVAGAVGGAVAFKPALRGLYKAAKAAKPYTAAFASAKKFRKAKQVVASVATTALARKYR